MNSLSRGLALGATLLAVSASAAVPAAQTPVQGVIVDAATDQTLPARIYIQHEDGRWFFPASASPQGSALRYERRNWVNTNAVENHTTLSAHPFHIELEPGRYTFTVERGKEYRPQTQRVEVGATPLNLRLPLTRWVNLAARGWYSGDTHVHRTAAELPNLLLAEDLNVAFPLSYWVTRAFAPPTQGDKNTDADGGDQLVSVDATHVFWPRNTEYEIFTVSNRSHTLGAVFVLGHKTPFTMGAPPVGPIAEQARREGALLDLDKHDWPWSMALVPVMGVDLYELANNHHWRTQFGFTHWSSAAPEWMGLSAAGKSGTERDWTLYTFQNYYALLNCGLRLRPTAGTASGVHPVPLGFGRVYVHLPGGFSYEAWRQGLNAGRSFVTTGPMLLAEVATNDLSGTVLSEEPVREVEVLINGEVRHRLALTSQKNREGAWEGRFRQPLTLDGTSWVAVRAFEPRPGNRLRFAHTAPRWFDVPGRPLRPRAEEVAFLIRRVRDQMERSGSTLPAEALAEYRKALQFYEGLQGEAVSASSAASPIRVLMFSGQNNHDWKTTTPKLKSILEQSGRFAVNVTERPDQCTAETLAKYDLVLSDWNAWGNAKVKTWPAAARAAFLGFLRRGKGYVSVHAGSSSFYDWPEYQQIGGLYWNLAETSHGPPHEFTVQFAGDHPVTRGLAPFRTKDELWLKPGVHPAARVLATGDGHTLAVTTALDEGRGFALLLGHGAEFMDTPGFQTLLLRGAEWAATGQVTRRATGEAGAAEADAMIQRVANYRFGDDRQAVLALERLVQAASVEAAERSRLAAKLAAALSKEASIEGKRCFLEGLSLVGSDAEVPALARALANTNLFDYARQALERIPGDQSESALQAALAATSGPARAGLIRSLAVRRNEHAVPEIARFLTDPDLMVAGAAVDALGQLGGARAAAALQAAENTVAPALRERFAVALLSCAESLPNAEAAPLYRMLVASSQPAHVRRAAFPSYVAALGNGGTAELLTALAGSDPVMQSAALHALRTLRQPALLQAAADKLETLPSSLQIPIIALCGERGGAALAPALTRAATRSEPDLRRAVIKALGLIGDARTVEPLVRLSETASDDDRKSIVEALARLRGNAVDDAILRALKSAPPAQQRTLIQAVAAREARAATADLVGALRSADAGVRREAIRALGKVADGPACRAMAQTLDQASEGDQDLLESALVEVCRRDPSAVSAIVNELPAVAPSSKARLVSVLGSVGGTTAGAAVRAQLKSENPAVRLAAVRVLAEWPDAEPLDDLATLVETTNDARIRALATRGLSRMAPQAPARAARAAEALGRALAATQEAAEQKGYLAALVEIPSLPSLKAAQAQLKNPALAAEAAAGLLRIAEVIYPWHLADVRAALADFRQASPTATLVQRADALAAKLEQPANLALGGLATSPDGLEKDGAANGDQAAIDGDPKTYWDEEDNQKLYRLRVQLRERSTVGCLRIMGWAQHNYAPKDFQVLCDDQVVTTVTGAQYRDNWLTVEFPAVVCDAVELKITGYHGASPAIRELEIYEKPIRK